MTERVDRRKLANGSLMGSSYYQEKLNQWNHGQRGTTSDVKRQDRMLSLFTNKRYLEMKLD